MNNSTTHSHGRTDLKCSESPGRLLEIRSKDSNTIIAPFTRASQEMTDLLEDADTCFPQKKGLKSAKNPPKKDSPSGVSLKWPQHQLQDGDSALKRTNSGSQKHEKDSSKHKRESSQPKFYLTNSEGALVSHRLYHEQDIGMQSPWNTVLIRKKTDDDDFDSDDDIIRYAIKLCINDAKTAISKEKLYNQDYLSWSQTSSDARFSPNHNRTDTPADSAPKNRVKNKSKSCRSRANSMARVNCESGSTAKPQNVESQARCAENVTVGTEIRGQSEGSLVREFQSQMVDKLATLNSGNFFMFQSNMSFFKMGQQSGITRVMGPSRGGRGEPRAGAENRRRESPNGVLEQDVEESTQDSENNDFSKTKKLLLRVPRHFKHKSK